jgi:hypothetical protein
MSFASIARRRGVGRGKLEIGDPVVKVAGAAECQDKQLVGVIFGEESGRVAASNAGGVSTFQSMDTRLVGLLIEAVESCCTSVLDKRAVARLARNSCSGSSIKVGSAVRSGRVLLEEVQVGQHIRRDICHYVSYRADCKACFSNESSLTTANWNSQG